MSYDRHGLSPIAIAKAAGCYGEPRPPYKSNEEVFNRVELLERKLREMAERCEEAEKRGELRIWYESRISVLEHENARMREVFSAHQGTRKFFREGGEFYHSAESENNYEGDLGG